MEKEKWVVSTDNGYRRECSTKEETIEEAKIVENSFLHPIAYIHKE